MKWALLLGVLLVMLNSYVVYLFHNLTLLIHLSAITSGFFFFLSLLFSEHFISLKEGSMHQSTARPPSSKHTSSLSINCFIISLPSLVVTLLAYWLL